MKQIVGKVFETVGKNLLIIFSTTTFANMAQKNYNDLQSLTHFPMFYSTRKT
jgi:hypothetical protein